MNSPSSTLPYPAHDILPPNTSDYASDISSQAEMPVTTHLLSEDVETGRNSATNTTCDSSVKTRPLPEAWDFTKPVPHVPQRLQPIIKPTIDILVMISHGHASLEQKWELIDTNEKFVEEKKKVSDRLTVITLVVSMMLLWSLIKYCSVPVLNCMSRQVYSFHAWWHSSRPVRLQEQSSTIPCVARISAYGRRLGSCWEELSSVSPPYLS